MSFADKENVPPIGEGLFNAMRMVLPKGGTVLELGSGDGSTTELLNAGYKVYSIEHNGTYVGRWNTVENTIHAPLLTETIFYDLENAKIPQDYDILLVDGPDTETRTIKFYEHGVKHFKPNVYWFFDDWAGDQMSIGIKATAKKTGRTLLIFKDKLKEYAVLLPEGMC